MALFSQKLDKTSKFSFFFELETNLENLRFSLKSKTEIKLLKKT